MRAEIEDELNRYFQKKFAKSLEEGVPVSELYQILAKPIMLDMDSPVVQRLNGIAMQTTMSSHVQKYVDLSKMFKPVSRLCHICHEDEYLKELTRLWYFGTIGLSIPDLQRKITRGGAVPMVNGKRITYDRLYFSFATIDLRLFEIWDEVNTKNGYKVPFSLNDMFSSINLVDNDAEGI